MLKMHKIFNETQSDASGTLNNEGFNVKYTQIRNVGITMKKSILNFTKLAIIFFGLCLFFSTNAMAGVEEYEYPHYVGVATATVNVREGAGVGFDQVTDASGKNIQLSTGDEVEILDEKKADDGIVWYHIAFTQKGVQYIGFSTSSYVAKDDDRVITPPPTPTPVPVEEEVVEKEDKEDIKEEVAEPATNAFEQEEEKNVEEEEEESSGSIVWTVFWLLVVVTVIFFGLYIALKYIKRRTEGQTPAPSRKVERFKQMNMQNRDAGRRVPQIRSAGGQRRPVPSEPRREVYVKHKETLQDNGIPINQADMEQDNEDKKLLREKIEQLQEHDLVRHVVYGEGEVYDNSDVKLLEVRFGNDMRFLKKDQLVNKRELVVFDDEDQSIARRRRRRVNNQNNRNY